ncbi:copper homeostasis protein CutC [Paenibacillus alkaliterrae]|uniref:copper homeostasis protein CutC n=1 Tax=Paenibacillus alkaliterrae TaxID=320909 RepID=UPI001F1FC6F4|nr:copper homeostasis protein CutC [Paenibacillus alkaliterrae]MCF2936945.1 copper homeostasis protein CutC [Paenibacillus alkaliterrae]
MHNLHVPLNRPGITLEVIAMSVSDALAAEAGGANRIELVSALSEGGLTPSIGLIERTLDAVSIDVQVMIRPHSRSFVYSEDDLETMLADIRSVRRLGRAGIVMGCLTDERLIDETALKLLLDEAGEMDITFHRAFDATPNLDEAFCTLMRYPSIKRVLTSAGQPSVLHAAGQLWRLQRLSTHSSIEIMAGSGLSIPSLPAFLQASQVREVHFGSGVHQPAGCVNKALVQEARHSLDKMFTPG